MNDLERKKNALVNEIKALLDWEDSEIEKIDEKLKSQGLFEEVLDTNQKYYAQVKKIKKRRWKEILEKYRDLPPDTEINFGAIVDRQKE